MQTILPTRKVKTPGFCLKASLLTPGIIALVLLMANLFFIQESFGQTTVVAQNFDAVNTMTFAATGTGGSAQTGSSLSTDRPASSTFYSSASTARRVTNGTSVLTFANVSGLSSSAAKFFEFRLAAWSIGSTTNGVDAGDNVNVEVSLDGGTVWSSELLVTGPVAGNAYWHYTTGTGVASVNYDGSNTPTTFQPAATGARTTDGYSTVRVFLPVSATQVRLRVTMNNNSANEAYTIDDVKLALPAYASQFISMSTGSSSWCSSETRNVTVTVKNVGTASWTTAGNGMNIGLKWDEDADYGSAPSNIPRQSVAAGVPSGTVASGTSVVYTFPNVPSSQVAGTNHLTFDVVKEGDCWFGNNNGSCGPGNAAFVSAAQTITLSATAVAGTAVTTCSNTGAVNITAGAGATNQASVAWTSSGTGTFANATSLTTATYTPSAADISAGSVTLTLTAVGNSPCANATSNKTLTINTLPTAVAGTAVTTCSTSGAVSITAGSGATNQASITWSVTSGTGTLSNANSLTTATYAPSAADITAGSRTIVLTANGNAGCSNVTSSKTITITSAPTAVAGTAVNTCSNSGAVSITAGSGATNAATTTWTSSGTGTFANANSLTTATYTPSAADISAGSVTLTLTSTPNSPCAANATSNKTLTINTLPTAVAGTAVSTCSTSGAVSITAGSSAANQLSILWSVTSGTGTLANSTSLTLATYAPSAADITAGSRTIVLTALGKAGCSNVTDSKTISITTAPTAAAGTALSTCSNTGPVNITAGSSATNAATTTWTSSGTGTFTNANSITLATYDPSAADISAGSVTLTLTSTPNSPCASNATSNKTLTINTLPTANAGTDVLTCSTSGAVNITAGSSASNQLSITWTSSNGTGTFASATSLTAATYNPSAADKTAGSRTLVLTALGKAGCSNVTSSKFINITAAPTAVAGTAIVTCGNSGAVNITAGSGATNQASVTWTSSGTGTFANANSLTTATYDPSAADILAGSVTLTLTANANTPCSNATSTKTITIRPVPTTAGVTICQGTGSSALTSSYSCTATAPITSAANFAGTAATGGSGTAWTASSGNLNVSLSANDNVYAAVTGYGTAFSQTLNATNFGFNGVIPTDATIKGIQVAIARFRGNSTGSTGDIQDNSLKLIKGGTVVGNNNGATSTNWPTSETVANYGTTTDLWGTTLSVSDVTASNFGVALVVDNTNTFSFFGTRTANIDYIQISITYIVPGTLNWYTVSSGGSSIGSGSSFDPVGILNSGLTNTNTAGTTTFYAECSTVTGCRTPTDYVITAAPAAPVSGGDQTVCENGNPTQTLTATATGGSITWYNASTNGSIVTPTQVGVGTSTYFAQSFDGTCSSVTRTAVTLTINAAPAAPTASNQTACEDGNPTQTLTATATGGTITWYDAAVSGNVVGSPTQTGVGTSTYYAEAFDGTCTSLTRTAVTLTINAAPAAPISGGDQTVCEDGNPTQTLTASATGGTITWYDQAVGGNVVPSPTQVGVGTVTYYAESSNGTCSSLTRTAVTLTITAAPVPPTSGGDQVVCENGNPTQTLTATATSAFTITWYDAAVGGNIVPIPEQVGVGAVTYYAESFDGTCVSVTRTAVTLTINPAPAAPTSGGDQTVCEDGNPTQTLTASATGGTITWYDAAVGGNIVTPTQVGVGTVTYYAESFDGTCSSLTRTAVTLTINPAPAGPISGGDQTVCEDGNPTQTLTATATGGTITWYDAAAGGNIVPVPELVGVGSVTYYAESFDGTCSSLTRTAVTLTINAAPAAPTASNQTACEDGNPTQTLTASATGGTITWYDAAVGGNVVASPTQVGVGTVTYYAESFNGTCVSVTRTAVTLTINPAPAAPTSGGDQTVCEDGNPTQTLTASATGGTITWYDAAVGGNIVTPTQVGVGTVTYYAESFNGTCSSLTRTAVTLTINAAPAAPTASNQTACEDGNPTQTLTASATGGTITWYDAAVGGNVVASPTQVGVGTVTYYAESFDGTCISLTRTAVTLTINPAPAGPISGGDQTVCSDGSPTQTLTATATGGTISWYDAATNGNIVTPTQVGVGTVTYYAESSNGTCSSLTRTAVTLTINPLPATPSVSVTQPTCATATGSITVNTPTGVGFTYSIGAGYQSSTVFPVLTANTYNVSVTNNFGCISLIPAVATVNPQPFVPGAPVISGIVNVCPYIGTGDLVTYTASVPGATSYNWILPPNVSLQPGAGPNSIIVTFNTGFAAQANKQIRVTAVSACGTSAQTIYYLIAQYPSTPGPITGPTDVCALIGTANTATYTINKVLAATSYAWTTPAGIATVNHPNGPGINDTTIVVTFAAGFSSSSITVAAVNGCGTSGSVRSLFIQRTASSTPGLITGPTNVCSNILPGGTAATYTILPVPGATSYNWTAPLNSIVTHPNGPGSNDYTITVTYPSGFTSGTISVSSTNGCGTSGVRSLSITRLNPATPSVIDVIQIQECPNRIYSYTLSTVPANSTSVVWTVPTSQGAVLLSQTATSITVSYPQSAVVGVVTAQSFNNCGSSTIRLTAVKIGACAPERTTIAGNTPLSKGSKQAVTLATPETMEVKVFPNPSVSDFHLEVLTAGKETISVRVLDMQGRELKKLTVMPYQTISIGADLKAGSYLIETRQGREVKTTKVIRF